MNCIFLGVLIPPVLFSILMVLCLVLYCKDVYLFA